MKSSDLTLKRVVQLVLLIWFVVINFFILTPSYRLLFARVSESLALVQPPKPPASPKPPEALSPVDSKVTAEESRRRLSAATHQLSIYTEQIKSYTQEVAAYTQQVASYKVQEEAKSKSSPLQVYQVVVKESLIALLGGFATTLIGFVFVNLGAGVVDNMVRVIKNKEPQPIRWSNDPPRDPEAGK